MDTEVYTLHCTSPRCSHGCKRVVETAPHFDYIHGMTTDLIFPDTTPHPVMTMQNSVYGKEENEGEHTGKPMHFDPTLVDMPPESAVMTGFDCKGEKTEPWDSMISKEVCRGHGRLIPSIDELLTYQKDGTYFDQHGMRHKSTHIMQMHHNILDAQHEQVTDSQEFVIKVPKGMKQAMNESEFGPQWKTAIYKELLGLFLIGCFTLERNSHPDVKEYGTIPSHFVFTAK